jgi:beta-lactamase class A
MHGGSWGLTDGEIARLAEENGLSKPSVVLIRLHDGRAAAYRAERPLYPASMIKVPLVAAALILQREGALHEARVRIDPANVTLCDGPSPLVAGYEATFEELCTLAITRSDNVATNQLYDLVGRERASALVRSRLGLRYTGFRRKLSGAHPLLRDAAQTGRNTFPACDAARLFGAIARDEFPGAALLYALLERQEWNTKLSAGLRPSDRFAHKTGDTEEVSHDGGILTTGSGERYVVVVYSACPASARTDARFAAFMRELRSMLAP